MPPIRVFMVFGAPHVVDGFHRLGAHRKLGFTDIAGSVVGDGTIHEAAWYATSVNADNGLRRTNDDKRKAVRMALANPLSSGLSARSVAGHVGVHVDMVLKARTEAEPKVEQPRRQDSSGRWQPPTKTRDVSFSDTSTPKPSESLERKTTEAPPDLPKHNPPSVLADTPTAEPPAVSVEPEAPTVEPPKNATADEYADHLRLLAARMRAAFKGTYMHKNMALDFLKRAEDMLRMAQAVDCPKCEGAKGGCRGCGDNGWVTRGDAKALERAR